MIEQSACPHCGAKQFPGVGSNDACASCGGRLSGAAGGTPPVREQLPRRAIEPLILTRLPPPEAFGAVRQGVNVVRWGAILGMVGAALAVAYAFLRWLLQHGAFLSLRWVTEERPFTALADGLSLFGLTLLLVSAVAVLVGVCLCCAAPKGVGAARWTRFVGLSIVLGAPLILLLVAGSLVHFMRPPSWLAAAQGPAMLLLPGVGAFGWVCYGQLLAALARAFGYRRLARAFGVYSLLPIGVVIIGVVGLCVATVIQVQEQQFRLIMAVLFGVVLALAAALTGRLIVLLTRLYRLIPAPGEPGPRRELQPPRLL